MVVMSFFTVNSINTCADNVTSRLIEPLSEVSLEVCLAKLTGYLAVYDDYFTIT